MRAGRRSAEIDLRMPMPLRLLGGLGLVASGAAVVGAVVAGATPVRIVAVLLGVPVLWVSLYLVCTRVASDRHGLLIVHGGMARRRLAWHEIRTFELHKFDPIGGGGYGPRIWVFCHDYDPRRPRASRPPRWDYFPVPLHWRYVGWRQMRELYDLKARLTALRAARAPGREQDRPHERIRA